MNQEWQRGDYLISTDRQRLNIEFIHEYLSTATYWATGRPLEVVNRSIQREFDVRKPKSDQPV